MLEKSHSFYVKDKNYDDIQRIMENVLEKKLSFSTDSKRLGRSLFRINYFDSSIDNEYQKRNRITILQEPEKKVYVQVNGKLTDSQLGQLWEVFEKTLNNSMKIEKVKKTRLSKEEIIKEIKSLIDERGYYVKNDDVQGFVESFMEKYNRFPKKDEINSIVKGYIIMVNEQKTKDDKSTEPFVKKTNLVNSEISLETDQKDLSMSSNDNKALLISDRVGRRKCPNCGNEGLIHEMDDKTVIILDYPKIYGKKNCCAECGYEWREH